MCKAIKVTDFACVSVQYNERRAWREGGRESKALKQTTEERLTEREGWESDKAGDKKRRGREGKEND